MDETVNTEESSVSQAEPVTSENNGSDKNGILITPEKELTKKQKRQRTLLRWTMIVIGIIMMSCSVYFFQTPNNFTLGGIAGVAIIINSFLPANLSAILTQGVIMVILNVLLLIVGLVILGKQCTIRTIICTLAYTGIIWLLERICPLDKPLTAQYVLDESGQIMLDADGMRMWTGSQPLLELVYAILLFGIGGALLFNCGASSGGTDIIALILKKYTSLNVGMALMLIDMVIVFISFYTFTVSTALFSLLGLFTKSFLLDSVIENIGKTKYITIITKSPEIISEYILKVINHGYTMYDAEGGYTHENKKVLITVCKRNEAMKIKMKLHEVDPSAFVIITDANEILGKGFGGTI